MNLEQLTTIPFGFRASSRIALVQLLQEIVNDQQTCDVNGLNHRQIAQQLGISESTWKRTRGVGGEWCKVDIYILLKFMSLYSRNTGIAIVPPTRANNHRCTDLSLTNFNPLNCD